MNFAFVAVLASFLVLSYAQFQYPPQFSDGPPQPFSPYAPYRGGYQLRVHNPPRFNPFDNVYGPNGEKLTCRMVCAPSDTDDEADVATKKDSTENKIEKKE